MRKSALTGDEWEAVKKRYFAGEAYTTIAYDYGLDVKVIKKYVQNHGWAKERRAIRAEAHTECLNHSKAELIRQGDRTALIASELLDIIETGVKEATLFQNAGDIQKLSSALLALRAMTGETAKRNAEEQQARIDKLKSETTANIDSPKQIKIVFGDDVADYAK